MCNHDENKDTTYMPIFNDSGEVYLCECGALIDIANEKNYRETLHPMTAEEITEAVRYLVNGTLENFMCDIESKMKAHRIGRQV